jgi:hypothetical protein
MARIAVQGESSCIVELTEADQEGRHEWTAGCGDQSDRPRFIADALADAEIHADIRCRWARGILSDRS